MANKKKNMLLIAPVFFGYYLEIIKEAELMNFDVDFFCDAPSNSNFSKAIGRINKEFIKGATTSYFRKKILPELRAKQYDVVLLVAGMTCALLPEMFLKIKELNSNAKFVMYQWDSEKNLPFSTKIHCYFDVIYSFDRNDCAAKSFYKFLPLFYTRNYETIGNVEKTKTIFDCSYVGTAHPLKFKNINTIADLLKKELPRQFIYHYMPSKLKYVYHRLTAPEYKKAQLGDFKMKKITAEENASIFKQSRCVLDSPQGGQTGLTIRTIECLGAKKKLVTANTDIVNYDFYREENILVVDNGKFNKNSKFFTEEYLELPEDIYKKYSLNNWLKTIIF